MHYFEPVKYIITGNSEMMWLTVGIIVGAGFMALIDYMIDRSKK